MGSGIGSGSYDYTNYDQWSIENVNMLVYGRAPRAVNSAYASNIFQGKNSHITVENLVKAIADLEGTSKGNIVEAKVNLRLVHGCERDMGILPQYQQDTMVVHHDRLKLHLIDEKYLKPQERKRRMMPDDQKNQDRMTDPQGLEEGRYVT
ncbi:hypothetical protein RF11_00071 [Thelohanellus kitauei]|uniref:Uncharacterized protein n=1 Tax=Thelohanellus kitauei TaxID=669202 RepID=A0A0C2NCT0_THEKT|nr:hypothetical protein RF11_00071 [Thelohanellus kitauei]